MDVNLAFLFILFTAGASAAADTARSRGGGVLGGSNANIANHPWQASLRNGGNHVCGAVLISPTRAATAAHCGGSATSAYSILAGTTERTVTTCATCALRNPIQGFNRHPNYANNPSAGYPNDIAVLWFFSIATNVNIDYAVLASNADGSFVGSSCTVSGWGRTEPGGPLPTTLQQSSMTVIGNQECVATWGPTRVRPEQICASASSSGVSLCLGDDGGPLTCAGRLAGVASWSEANCGPAFPTVFVRVSDYRDWILEQ